MIFFNMSSYSWKELADPDLSGPWVDHAFLAASRYPLLSPFVSWLSPGEFPQLLQHFDLLLRLFPSRLSWAMWIIWVHYLNLNSVIWLTYFVPQFLLLSILVLLFVLRDQLYFHIELCREYHNRHGAIKINADSLKIIKLHIWIKHIILWTLHL